MCQLGGAGKKPEVPLGKIHDICVPLGSMTAPVRQAVPPAPGLCAAKQCGRSALTPLPAVPWRPWRCSYFDTDFLNIRSIFSLICSIACEFC